MDFFHGQASLTTLEWVLRAAVSFFFLVIIAKVLGQRAISQLRLLDFVIALVIGNIIAHPLSDEELGLKGSVITTMVLVILYLASIFSILKWPLIRNWVNHKPIKLIQNGEIHYKGLLHARISIDVLLEELRKEKIEDIQKVALAFWEAEGKISIFLDPKYLPVTAEMLQIKTNAFHLPKTIIMDGKIIKKELNEAQKDERWLVTNLESLYQTEVKNVLLATIDNNDKLNVFLYK
ncbi:membrane protein [Bacillus sp. SA1-12]|uniref:DUF421 domain-containing protein n=1 Tax=Bacillus sp. SA1-12 TaxID=1455638 RepID=UPI0006273BA3|nr:DUF421 domain-containing protein [Bacillus sp. SA1-12]KKI89535.1 membrane protein [Bacillus sp. SA1-12]